MIANPTNMSSTPNIPVMTAVMTSETTFNLLHLLAYVGVQNPSILSGVPFYKTLSRGIPIHQIQTLYRNGQLWFAHMDLAYPLIGVPYVLGYCSYSS